jgi:hypothetical protein
MEAFWAEEKARKEAIALKRTEQRERERKAMVVVGIVTAVAILGLIAAAIIVSVI